MQRIMLVLAAAGMIASAGCSRAEEGSFATALARYELAGSVQLAAADDADDGTATDTPSSLAAWLALGDQSAYESYLRTVEGKERAGDGAERAEGEAAPWWKRRGPAYAGDFWKSFERDAKEFPAMVWDDTKATVTNPLALGFLAAAGVTGIALSGNRGNDQVADHYTKHGSQLNTFWDTVGDVGGNPGTHFAVAGALYLTSLARGDDKNYEAAKSMLSALAINGVATMALKVAARTESPNGDEFGWPSGHTSSSFCFAAVAYEHYGPWAGVPLYAFAAYVGYERIDARNHDFADVISGALIGIAIGHAVASNHQPRVLGMDIVPYADPRGGAGIALSKRW